MNDFLQAIQLVAAPDVLIAILASAVYGLVVGSLPGLSATMATALLVPVAVVSTFAGVWLVRRVDAARFYTLIYVLMVLLGLKLMADALIG